MRRNRTGGEPPRICSATLELPTAVVAFNDHCGFGVMGRLQRAGVSVPADVSVTGFDDAAIARYASVDLTTVSQDAVTQATWAVQTAVARLDGEVADAQRLVVEPALVLRSTTDVPRTGPVHADGTGPRRRWLVFRHHHEDRRTGPEDDLLRGAAHEGLAHGRTTTAADHQQLRVHLAGDPQDGVGHVAPAGVQVQRPGEAPPGRSVPRARSISSEMPAR